jgi:hypothetical protein
MDVVMLQLRVELPPGASAPGGPSAAYLSCTLSADIRQDLRFRSRGEQLGIEEFITQPAVVGEVERSSYDSANPFSYGDLGAMWAVLEVLLASHQSRRA